MKKNLILLFILLFTHNVFSIDLTPAHLKWDAYADDYADDKFKFVQGVGKDTFNDKSTSNDRYYLINSAGNLHWALGASFVPLVNLSTDNFVVHQAGVKAKSGHLSGIQFEYDKNGNRHIWTLESKTWDGFSGDYKQVAYRMNMTESDIEVESSTYDGAYEVLENYIITSTDTYTDKKEKEIGGVTVVRNVYGPAIMFANNFAHGVWNDNKTPTIYVYDLNKKELIDKITDLPAGMDKMQGITYSYDYDLFFLSNTGPDYGTLLHTDDNEIYVLKIKKSGDDFSSEHVTTIYQALGEEAEDREIEGMAFDDNTHELYISMVKLIPGFFNNYYVPEIYAMDLDNYSVFDKYKNQVTMKKIQPALQLLMD